jgi:hypothetical protein
MAQVSSETCSTAFEKASCALVRSFGARGSLDGGVGGCPVPYDMVVDFKVLFFLANALSCVSIRSSSFDAGSFSKAIGLAQG